MFTESFNKADGSLGPDLTWAPLQSAPQIWEVTGNQASPRGATRGLVEYARAEHDVAGSDMYAQVVVTALSAGSQGGPAVRFDPAAATFYGVEVFGNGDVSIQRVVAGARTAIGSGTVTVTLPATLRLEVAGDSLTAFWAGVQAATATDANIASGTRGGIMGFEQTGQGLGLVVDSFEVGDLGAGGEAHQGSGLACTVELLPGPGGGSPVAAGTGQAASVTLTLSSGIGTPAVATAGQPVTVALIPGLGGGTPAVAAAGQAATVVLTPDLGAGAGAGSGAGNGQPTAVVLIPGTGLGTPALVGAGLACTMLLIPAPGAELDVEPAVVTPPERTFTVDAEPRTLTVPADQRTLTIPAEVRHVDVPA